MVDWDVIKPTEVNLRPEDRKRFEKDHPVGSVLLGLSVVWRRHHLVSGSTKRRDRLGMIAHGKYALRCRLWEFLYGDIQHDLNVLRANVMRECHDGLQAHSMDKAFNPLMEKLKCPKD